ncbi:hypothetical protein Microterr_13380 [Microbacterium terricola]|uniref:Uncharacterized protein n=1 Tax=Microbacterium terricola TaxID=344163 RepID=A0ABM8DYB9_9MICO|nr:hypothetical protein Microterr_13380 [Microbacterium terricola]
MLGAADEGVEGGDIQEAALVGGAGVHPSNLPRAHTPATGEGGDAGTRTPLAFNDRPSGRRSRR